VQLFRSLPLLLLIVFSNLMLPRYGFPDDPMYYLITGLVLYNSAMLAEVFRAGILSLDRGQSEAAMSLGMTYWQSMLLVVVPQATRRMVPSIVSQLVILMKDTSLGYVIAVFELLRRARVNGDYYSNPLQSLFVVAVMYFVVSFGLSRLAAYLERRQQRRPRAAVGAPSVEETVNSLV
jgi:glutamate transport system permease protein